MHARPWPHACQAVAPCIKAVTSRIQAAAVRSCWANGQAQWVESHALAAAGVRSYHVRQAPGELLILPTGSLHVRRASSSSSGDTAGDTSRASGSGASSLTLLQWMRADAPCAERAWSLPPMQAGHMREGITATVDACGGRRACAPIVTWLSPLWLQAGVLPADALHGVPGWRRAQLHPPVRLALHPLTMLHPSPCYTPLPGAPRVVPGARRSAGRRGGARRGAASAAACGGEGAA